ncbi:hypothetical protein [Streptomyces griseus]|uniref:hypothetical protein n=1 Tax=Streptomyces griseus TaxID=1911 RepID=UPI00341BF5A5
MDYMQDMKRNFTLTGISFLGFVSPREMISPSFAWELNALSFSSGRVDVEVPRIEGDCVSRGNSAWFAMAKNLHVLNSRREFLLAVEDPFGDLLWGRVSLAEKWDFIEVGSALGVTGSREGFPGFALMSIDGNSAIVGHSNETSISFTGAARLKEIAELRESASRLAFHSPHLGNDAALAAKEWLGLHPKD